MRPSFLRVPFVSRASIQVDGRVRQATVCNLSPFGLYLQVDAPPEGCVHVRFPLPDGGPLVEATATVTWFNDARTRVPLDLPVGCGLRFESILIADLARIERVVDGYRPASSPAEGSVLTAAGSTRVAFAVPCSLVGPSGIARGTTCNLGVRGLFVAVDRIPDLGDTVHVELDLPGLDGRFERAGSVSWQNLDTPERPHALPPGCGVRLRNLSEEDVALLERLVAESFAALSSPAV